MERIHEETEETIFLSIRRGTDAVCIERLEGKWVHSWAFRVGGVMPPHLGAGPRVLLAHQPRAVWLEYLSAGPLVQLTKHSATTPDELLPILEDIRERGYGHSDQDVVIGIAAIGAAIFDHSGTIRAALSMSGPRQSILEDHAERNFTIISHGAAEISRLLGYQPTSIPEMRHPLPAPQSQLADCASRTGL
jgi:DNA-binding IclR family transcriptional regulator